MPATPEVATFTRRTGAEMGPATATQQDRGDITNEELHSAYLQFCHARKWRPVTTKTFQVKLADLMPNAHGGSQRNDIRRGDNCRRGYSGVALSAVS